ncbi:hypothetical protein LAM19_21685, partial [Mycobacterium tuberculosis]|nr:hypothetical protein [Mycobacterium tuberculosis]
CGVPGERAGTRGAGDHADHGLGGVGHGAAHAQGPGGTAVPGGVARVHGHGGLLQHGASRPEREVQLPEGGVGGVVHGAAGAAVGAAAAGGWAASGGPVGPAGPAPVG